MLKAVSKDEFYGVIYHDKLNVHPRPEADGTYWEFTNRHLFGMSTPGWKCEGPQAYFLETHLIA